MGLVHHLSRDLIVTPLKSIAHVKHTLHFADHVLGAKEVLLRNLLSDFVEPYSLGIAEELHLRMVLTYGSGRILAGSAALVVGR